MIMHEKNLSMADRSIVSQYFSGTGRELGLFFESKLYLGKIALKPSIAITTETEETLSVPVLLTSIWEV